MTRSPLLLALALTLVFCASASAAGFNLAWGDCGSFGSHGRMFFCSTNAAGPYILIASLIPEPGIDQFVGAESVIDLQTADAVLAPWWQLQTGGCRQGALSASFSFAPFSNCLEPWHGQQLGAVDYVYPLFSQPNRARIRVVCAQPLADSGPLAPGAEYYMFEIVFSNIRAGLCAGCSTQQMIFELVNMRITQPEPIPSILITQPNQPNSNRVVWQGDASVPVRNRAWGAIKAIYH